MEKYIKCPRCEINYILEKQKLCDVCKAELKLAPDIYSEEDEEMVLCPICKTNYIFPDEDMCSSCRDNNEDLIVEKEPDVESDEDWRSFLDDEKEVPVPIVDDEVEVVSLNQLHDEEAEKVPDDEAEFDFGGSFDYDEDFEEDDDDDDEDEDDKDDDDERI
ncbi:MAG: hypothetical protein RR107_05305 [Clostridia bacterium]